MSHADLEHTIRELVTPIAESMNLFVYDVEVVPGQGSGMVRVLLERLTAEDEGSGVNVDELTKASRELGYILDVEDPVPFAYRLEVSSPGVERKLRTEEHFEAALGEEVRVILRQPTEDQRSVLEGELLAGEEPDEWAVRDSKGVVRAFPIRHVKKAHTRFDFEKSKQKKK
jgi:ribosome maturation factor RimP